MKFTKFVGKHTPKTTQGNTQKIAQMETKQEHQALKSSKLALQTKITQNKSTKG